MTRFGDWAAMILAAAGVLGCVAAVGTLMAGRVAGAVRTAKALRVAAAGGRLGAAGPPLKQSARPAAVLGAAAVFLMSAWLTGDDLTVRCRTGQVLRFGGWLELMASAVLAAWGVRVLIGIARRSRAERDARRRACVAATVGPQSNAVR